MPETPSHRRAKNKAAGPGGQTEVPLPGGKRLDARTQGGGRATEVERSGSAQGLEAAASRLKQTRAPQKVLQVPQKDMDAAQATGQYAVEKAGDNPGFLNNFAWSLLTDEGLAGQFDQLALEAAKRCDEQTESENWMYIDTLALAQFETGAKKEALGTQIKAIALAKEKGVAGGSLEELEASLERFKADQGK